LAVTADSANASFRTLHGRWLRPDGGDILDIRNVEARGGRSVRAARVSGERSGHTYADQMLALTMKDTSP
jgi:hypothetical protein